MGCLAERDRTASTTPANRAEPRPRCRKEAWGVRGGRRRCPAVEPGSRAAGIDSGDRPKVLAEIEQDVADGGADLAGSSQYAGEIALAPHGSVLTALAV